MNSILTIHAYRIRLLSISIYATRISPLNQMISDYLLQQYNIDETYTGFVTST